MAVTSLAIWVPWLSADSHQCESCVSENISPSQFSSLYFCGLKLFWLMPVSMIATLTRLGTTVEDPGLLAPLTRLRRMSWYVETKSSSCTTVRALVYAEDMSSAQLRSMRVVADSTYNLLDVLAGFSMGSSALQALDVIMNRGIASPPPPLAICLCLQTVLAQVEILVI
ncbi:hypothetical protein CONLIGDRAFT_162392 [Coniochaeta ligniaria NRRL 30616]|uniref:Uncharacterized protein n=1 Tax=Coniochaeta ligniaria NRRL 30616 TaxID=1408157 RepID=A0A1J7JZ18_9PEZI|nr:hypothetical protein CONLIGDRAFT_162392 [Coniochaeta ligniaria NRRL 30616]